MPKVIFSDQTKLGRYMNANKLGRKDVYEKIKEKSPENPVSMDGLTRIINGSRKDYSTDTLLRICKGLNLSPNDLLDWEEVEE